METAVQRTISAADAPPAAAPGATASVFGMAQAYLQGAPAKPPAPAPAPVDAEQPAAARRKPLLPRAKQVLEACGPLTMEQLAEGLGVDLKAVARLVKNAGYRGLLRMARDGEGREVVELVPPTALKRFLAGRGEAGIKSTKSPRAKRKTVSRGKNGGGRTPARKEAAPAKVKRAGGQPAGTASTLPDQVQGILGIVPAAPQPAGPRGAGGFRCGLYSDGSLEIHTAEKSIDLTRDQVRELVAYLDKLASAIAE